MLVIIFQPNLPLADMKARLVLNRLSTKARILSTDPPVERLDEIDPLTTFTVYLTADVNDDELRSLADVEGVAEIRIEPLASPTVQLTSSSQDSRRTSSQAGVDILFRYSGTTDQSRIESSQPVSTGSR